MNMNTIGAQGAGTPGRDSQITAAGQKLMESIKTLEELSARIKDRLGVVLRPEPTRPEHPDGGKSGNLPEPLCAMAEGITQQAQGINKVNGTLGDILARLEV